MKNSLAIMVVAATLALGAFAPIASAQSFGYGGGQYRRATPGVPATPAVPGVSPAVPATPAVPAGRVLGAEAFNFTVNLRRGMSNADVVKLQQFLIDGGYSISFGATGYFGLQTRAAVIAFQKANGIAPAVGFVGPLTRAKLNNWK